MKPGDRVKLLPKVAANQMKGMNSGHRPVVRVDWAARRGTIASVNHAGAVVQWDDRASVDQWPTNALCEA